MKLTQRQTHGSIWLLALLPTAVALGMLRPGDLASVGSLLNYLGRLTGIAGLSLMLMAAVLSCRVPGFDEPFGGLTKLWRTHHLLAAAAFLLLLAHPLLLAFAAAEASLHLALSTLLPGRADPALWSGWAALLLMMIFLAPGFKFFGDPDYQRWKNLHRLAAPAVILALVHSLFLARTLPWPADAVFWLALAALAVASMGYRFLYARTLGRQRYRVERVAHPASNVVELSLAPRGELLRYTAGQFVYLTALDPTLPAGHRQEHPYTISSAPEEPELRIAIQGLGDASRELVQHARPGIEMAVEGPYGAFFPSDESGDPELWIAGGIGITPFLGRIRHILASQSPIDAVLIFCVQDESRALFLDELVASSAREPGLRLQMHYFHQQGPLAREFVETACPDAASRTVHACGPMPLLSIVHSLARQIGVPHSRIVTEEFDLL